MLAHRRLSILDLSSMGAQPMQDPVTGHVVVLNGEIYNYVDLRDRLRSAGQNIHSSGDTAVMLRLLGLHGPEGVRQLRGMFALACWDPRERLLMLARDSLGIKPLYLIRNSEPNSEWSVAFASEVRSIIASGLLLKPRLNPMAAASMAWNGFMVTPETAVAGVESMWPGTLLVFDSEGHEKLEHRFWSASARAELELTDEREVEQVLKDCVGLHLASDVPLGVFLSGGVDSSVVANLAQKTSKNAVHTFTLAFEESAFNEAPIARRIAEAIGTRHQEMVLTEERFVSELEFALDSLDQPTFDGLNSYYMSRIVRDAGFKVALVGTGGDELFGGYPTFRELPILRRWLKRAAWLPDGVRVGFAELVSSIMQSSSRSFPGQTRWAKFPAMARRGADLLSLYQLAYALFVPDTQRQLLGRSTTEALADGLPSAMRSRLERESESRSLLSAIGVMEERMFLGERLLRDTDAASMASSLEVRLPLVDHVLFEAVDGLSDELRFRPLRKKSLLRRVGLSGLDPALFNRQKAGFVLPYDQWLRKGLGKLLDRTMRDPIAVQSAGLNPETVLQLWKAFLAGAPGIYWSRVWALYVFIRWCHRYGVTQ